MYQEDKLYLQIIIGGILGVGFGIVAFFLVTNCMLGSVCKTVAAAETSDHLVRESREGRLVPQHPQSDLIPIVVEWAPQMQAAMEYQVSRTFALDDGVLATGHKLSGVPDSFSMAIDSEILNYLTELDDAELDGQHFNWAVRDWMIVTGGYNLLSAVALGADEYDMHLSFHGNEFRTAIVGYDSAEAASIDLVKIRTDLRKSAQRAAACDNTLECSK